MSCLRIPTFQHEPGRCNRPPLILLHFDWSLLATALLYLRPYHLSPQDLRCKQSNTFPVLKKQLVFTLTTKMLLDCRNLFKESLLPKHTELETRSILFTLLLWCPPTPQLSTSVYTGKRLFSVGSATSACTQGRKPRDKQAHGVDSSGYGKQHTLEIARPLDKSAEEKKKPLQLLISTLFVHKDNRGHTQATSSLWSSYLRCPSASDNCSARSNSSVHSAKKKPEKGFFTRVMTLSPAHARFGFPTFHYHQLSFHSTFTILVLSALSWTPSTREAFLESDVLFESLNLTKSLCKQNLHQGD